MLQSLEKKLKMLLIKFSLMNLLFNKQSMLLKQELIALGIQGIIGKSNDYVFDDVLDALLILHHGGINDIEGISKTLRVLI